MKIKCQVCGEEFEAKRITKKRCIVCQKKVIVKRVQKYYNLNKPIILKKNKILVHNWYLKNKHKIQEQSKIYREQHKDKTNKQFKEKYSNNPIFKVAVLFRGMLYLNLKKQLATKQNHSKEICGCTWKELVNHIESQFQTDMSWSNYGKWQIDHIKPCASFDLSKTEQLFECFHFTNLQPLWAKENKQKGSYLDGKRYFHQKSNSSVDKSLMDPL